MPKKLDIISELTHVLKNQAADDKSTTEAF